MAILVEVRKNGQCAVCKNRLEGFQCPNAVCLSRGCIEMATTFVLCGEPYGQGDSLYCEKCGKEILEKL